MYGLEDFDQSIKVIEEITKRDTAEFAIRPFIKEDYDRVEVVFEKWKNSDNAHLRRLVTEGPRPRLPWAKHISYLREDINENFNLLKPFLNDPSRYVEKSVANHLNDLSCYEADQVVVFLESHFEASSPFVLTRALRTLKTQEHQGALDLFRHMKEVIDSLLIVSESGKDILASDAYHIVTKFKRARTSWRVIEDEINKECIHWRCLSISMSIRSNARSCR